MTPPTLRSILPPVSVRPRLLVLSCGGTISATGAVGQAVTPTLDSADLVAGLTSLAAEVDIEARTFSTVPSADMTFEDLVRLRAEIDEWIRTNATGAGPFGVVVTHGTDTLEETAFALDLLGASDVPVVVTGAMRNPTLPGTDGVANLLAAAQTALSPDAHALGVLVVANDEIHLAAIVRKGHTSSPATFVSAPFGPVGYVAEGRVRIVLRPQRRHHLPGLVHPPSTVPVALLAVGLGEDARLLGVIRATGYAGIVVEGVGGGHLPERVAASKELAGLVSAMPVVIASRTRAGELLHRTYRFVGSELDLAERGMLSAGRLDAAKARVLLTLALAANLSRDAIAGLFAEIGGYAVDQLDSPEPPTGTGEKP